MSVQENAKRCTEDLVEALESLICGDSNKAVIYGNSAIAAAIVLFDRYEINQADLKSLFDEVWMPVAIPAIEA